MKIEKFAKSQCKMDITKFMSIRERSTSTGRSWYSISADNGKLYALSERKFAQAEQLVLDITPETQLSVWYFENDAFNNICGISANFTNDLTF